MAACYRFAIELDMPPLILIFFFFLFVLLTMFNHRLESILL